MNCGFEDCALLDEVLAKGIDEAGFSLFSKLRKPNADAIADMAVENFVEMRDKVADPKFLFEREVEKVLMREFPGDYINRYGMVSFSRIPYRVAYEAGVIQQTILTELCKGLAQPAQVDLVLAKKLIAEKLVPLVRG
jgi:kynurenine 3-monooxygenase